MFEGSNPRRGADDRNCTGRVISRPDYWRREGLEPESDQQPNQYVTDSEDNPVPRGSPQVALAVTGNSLSCGNSDARKAAVPTAASPPKSHRRGLRHDPPHAEPGRMPRGFQ